MPYTAEISRLNPGCFLFLVIQCMTIPHESADAVNRIVDTLSQRCSSGMDVRDYFHIGVLGFSTRLFGTGIKTTYALPGTSPERPFLPISKVVEVADIEERQVREDYGGGEIVEVTRRMPVWLKHHNGGLDPMCAMLRSVEPALAEWIGQHPDSYPPIVIIICDGYATDGNPLGDAERIKSLRTNDGNVLLFTVHLSHNNQSRPTLLPQPGRWPAFFRRGYGRFQNDVPYGVGAAGGQPAGGEQPGLCGGRKLPRISFERRRRSPGAVPRHRHPRPLQPALTVGRPADGMML